MQEKRAITVAKLEEYFSDINTNEHKNIITIYTPGHWENLDTKKN